jgi:hypothetical protein
MSKGLDRRSAVINLAFIPHDLLGVDHVLSVIRRVKSALDIHILIVGSREISEIFRVVTDPRGRPTKQVFLWYNLLSDIPDMENSDLVVNWLGHRSRGWGGWAEKATDVAETFRFACPNNPAVRAKALTRVRELLTRYPFDGIFLDKIRFPSPASGLDEVVSCFCDHRCSAASAVGLDLKDVARIFERVAAIETPDPLAGRRGTFVAGTLAGADSLLARFLRFRSDSIKTRRPGARRGIAPRPRGFDRSVLARPSAFGWPRLQRPCKVLRLGKANDLPDSPTSRIAFGIPGSEVRTDAKLSEASIAAWASRPAGLRHTSRCEARRSAAGCRPDGAARGLGALSRSWPRAGAPRWRREITPEHVIDMVRAGRKANVAGAIVSGIGARAHGWHPALAAAV